MKISERNTALNLLYKEVTPFDFGLSEDTEYSPIEYKRKFGLSIVREWPKMQPLFNKRVRYISDPFFKAYEKATSKLAGVIDAEPLTESGTIITKRDGGGTNNIFYSIKTSGKDSEFKMNGIILFFGRDPHKDKPTLDIFTQRLEEGTKEYLADTCTKNGITSMSIFADILSLLLFIKYCELETKIIEGGSKGYHVGEKYKNETKQKVEILDSTWFTTIIRSEGFSVGAETGGFFRLQLYGPERSKRKLIWVLPFEKEGYTRTAKMISE